MEVAILKFNNDAYSKGKSRQTSYLQTKTNGDCFIFQDLSHRSELFQWAILVKLVFPRLFT